MSTTTAEAMRSDVPAPPVPASDVPPPFPPPPPQDDLKKRAIRGSVVSLLGKFTEQTVRFISNLALTRLLFPEAFGVMGLVVTVLVGLEMLSDLGVRISVITSRREDDDFLDTAWTISVLRGFALWAAGWAFAVPFANFYHEPSLKLMVPVAAFSAVLQGAKSCKMYVLSRNIHVGRLAAIELSAQTVGSALMIVLAALLHSTWALVIGSVAMTFITCVLSHVAIPGRRDRFRWDKAAAREIMNLGGWIFISTVLTFLAMRIDILLLGKLVPKAMLGVYNIASGLSGLPQMAGSQIIGWVLLPALASAYRRNHEALASTFARARSAIMPAGGFICLGVALGSPVLFYALFDVRYRDAAWMTPILMLGAWFNFLQEASSRALQAMGTARPLAAANASKLVATVIGCEVGYWLFGVPGFILGAAMGALAGHAVTVAMLVRAGMPAGRSDVGYTVVGVLLATFGVGAPIALERWLGWHRMPVAIITAALILAPTGLWTLQRLKAAKSATA